MHRPLLSGLNMTLGDILCHGKATKIMLATSVTGGGFFIRTTPFCTYIEYTVAYG